VDGPQPEKDGTKPTSSDDLVLALVGDVPDGRVLLAGELDILTTPRLEQMLTELLSTGYRHVSVDCSGVNFLAAAGLNVFCRATCRYREAGGRLHLVALPRQIRRVLVITGLDTRLNLERFGEPGPETLPATRSNGAGPAPRTPPHGTRHAHAGTPHRLPAPDPATSLPSQRANSRGRADPD
jgi:anti-sigma B factor antagonist